MAEIIMRPKITIEDLVQLDEDKRFEVVNGILKDNTVTAGFTHITITTNLYDILKPWLNYGKSELYQVKYRDEISNYELTQPKRL